MDYVAQLRLFIEVAGSGNFSRAGRGLGLSTSSVSRKIAALEEELGAKLLHRGGRELTLTDAGQVFLERAETLVLELERSKLLVRSFQSKPEGLLRVGSFVQFGEHILCDLIPKFSEAYPEVSVELRLEDRLTDLIAEDLDLSFRIGKLESASLGARILLPNTMVLFAAPTYLEKHGTPRGVEDLEGHACITYQGPIPFETWIFRRGDHQQRFKLRPNLRVNSGKIMCDWALAGMGLCMLPYWYVTKALSSGKLVRLLPDYEVLYPELEGRDLHVVYPYARVLPPKIRVFLDFVIHHLEQIKSDMILRAV